MVNLMSLPLMFCITSLCSACFVPDPLTRPSVLFRRSLASFPFSELSSTTQRNFISLLNRLEAQQGTKTLTDRQKITRNFVPFRQSTKTTELY